MRKLILLALAIVALLSAASCTQQQRITLTPSEVTIKVGESTQLHPGFDGEVPDSEYSQIVRIIPEDGIVVFDKYYNVTGVKVGNTQVGVGVYNDPNDETKGFKYTAYTVVHVVAK